VTRRSGGNTYDMTNQIDVHSFITDTLQQDSVNNTTDIDTYNVANDYDIDQNYDIDNQSTST
jgi:hypothetical protein